MWDYKLVITPIDINRLEPSKEGFKAIKVNRNQYVKAIGLLIYTILGSRPDIIYAILVYSRYIGTIR